MAVNGDMPRRLVDCRWIVKHEKEEAEVAREDVKRIISASTEGSIECPRSCYWQHEAKIEAIRTGRAPVLGALVHARITDAARVSLGMEPTDLQSIVKDLSLRAERIMSWDPSEGMQFVEDVSQMVQDSQAYFDVYQRWVASNRPGKFKPFAVERRYEVPIATSGGGVSWTTQAAARLDLLEMDMETGEVVDHEIKTATLRNAPDAIDAYFERLLLDAQIRLQCYCASQGEGMPIRRVLYTVIRKVLPKRPEINKDGTMSAALVDTDMATLKEVAAAAKCDIYSPRYDRLRDAAERFTQIIEREMMVGEAEMRDACDNALVVSKTLNFWARTGWPRNTRKCFSMYGRRCPFFDLCAGRITTAEELASSMLRDRFQPSTYHIRANQED